MTHTHTDKQTNRSKNITSLTEVITVQKIPKKFLSKCPTEFGFFSPNAYAVPGVRGTPLPLFLISASPGCETQLIGSIDDWSQSINMNRQTDAIVLDCNKAFNKVSHTKLLYKIRYYGMN